MSSSSGLRLGSAVLVIYDGGGVIVLDRDTVEVLDELGEIDMSSLMIDDDMA